MSDQLSTKSTHSVISHIYDHLVGLVGEAFFAALMEQLAKVANADYAFVGEFSDANKRFVLTEAVYADGQIIDNIEFPLENTPCDVVIEQGLKYYPRDVIKLFPLDHLAIQMEVDSYIGIPLLNSRGEAMGPLAVFSRKPMENIEQLEDAMRMFALRAASELERLGNERQRQEELHFLQSLIDAIPNPIFYKNVEGAYLGCNQSYEKMIGRSRDQIVHQSVMGIHPPERAEIARREDARVFDSRQTRTYESSLNCTDGSVKQVLFNKAPLFDRQGKMMGLVGTIQDISRFKQVETALQALVEGTLGYTGGECYRRVAEQLCNWFEADCTIVGALAGNGKVRSLATCRRGVQLSGYEFQAQGTPCQKVLDDGTIMIHQGLLRMFPSSAIVIELAAQGYVGTPVNDQSGKTIGVISILSSKPIQNFERARDVLAIMAARVGAEIEREQSQQLLQENRDHLNYLVYHDALTGLPNRQMFSDHLQHAIAMATLMHHRLGILFLDLDHFKKINDSLGHEVGDRVLCEVATRLRNCLRDVDTLARLGGDEFAILIDQTISVENVVMIAEEISHKLAEVIQVDDYKLFVTSSIGISMYPQDGQDVVALLKAADAAMFRAKELGRDNYHFYAPGMNERASELLMMEAALRQAVEQEELMLQYQPQYDLMTRQIIGVEALVRWCHPQHGTISPLDFIPLAEETGLIVPIGEWVLRRACTQGAMWQGEGLFPLRIAVNISARQFRQVDLVEMVTRILQETGFPATSLDLEITESILMEDVNRAIETMVRLSRLGVKLSIDDFGTGYSSLAYLKRFPIDYLKIDRSFVRDVVEDPNDAAIAVSIIDLARNMGLGVIAEGIETEAQRSFLSRKGCRYGQGYYFSQPIPTDELTGMLRSQFS
ncbi:MAG: EAL domain-containing protein [Desulfuromonadaceae bacterium]|nr:EAL domain-containing protein [Desulfuromonadaceae bacterium]